MAKKATELEGAVELARLMQRWPALRNEPGDEVAYEFAHAVRELHKEVMSNTTDLGAGIAHLAPLIQQIKEKQGGGGLFAEARRLVKNLEDLKP